MNNPSIGIVTVTYNSHSFLFDFYKSIISQEFKNYKIFCIDNNSNDKTRQFLSKINDKRWINIFNKENIGSAGGNNIGIKKCLDHKLDYVLLINNDVKFGSDFLRLFISNTLKRNLEVNVPKIFFESPAGKIWYGGKGAFSSKWTSFYAYNHPKGKDNIDLGQYDLDGSVTYAPTCAMLINTNLFKKVGLMDEFYFCYFDDTDFVYRLLKNNITIGYTGVTSLVHKVGGSSGGYMSNFRSKYSARNRTYFYVKHFGIFYALLWIPVYTFYYIVRFTIERNFSYLYFYFIGLIKGLIYLIRNKVNDTKYY